MVEQNNKGSASMVKQMLEQVTLLRGLSCIAGVLVCLGVWAGIQESAIADNKEMCAENHLTNSKQDDKINGVIVEVKTNDVVILTEIKNLGLQMRSIEQASIERHQEQKEVIREIKIEQKQALSNGMDRLEKRIEKFHQ